MESFWIELAKQIPSLAVLCILVVLFIRHMKDEGDRGERMEKEKSVVLKQISDACHESQKELVRETTETIARATTIIDRNTEILGKTIHIIDSLERGAA